MIRNPSGTQTNLAGKSCAAAPRTTGFEVFWVSDLTEFNRNPSNIHARLMRKSGASDAPGWTSDGAKDIIHGDAITHDTSPECANESS